MGGYAEAIKQATATLMRHKGDKEVIVVGGRSVEAFIHEDTQETSEPVMGGSRRILAVRVTVRAEDFPTAPKAKTVCKVNSNKLLIESIDSEPGLHNLNLINADSR